MRGEFVLALAANFLVAGVVASLKGTSAGAVSFGIGAVLFVIWHFTRKKNLEPQTAPVANQDVKQEVSPRVNVNPQISVSVGNSTATAAAPAPRIEDEQRCNIHFVGVGVGEVEQQRVLSPYTGQTIKYAAAAFENKAIPGERLRLPRVRVRLIFRHPDEHIVADVSNAAWIRPPLESPSPYMRLQANTPQHVVLFWLVAGQLTCQSIIEDGSSHTRLRRRSFMAFRTHELNEKIGTVEVQLLTESEHLYTVLLKFQDDDKNILPVFTGVAEPAE